MKTVPVLVVALIPASLALAIAFGSVDLGPARLADAILGRGDEIAREIVWGVRAPRALAAFACGGSSRSRARCSRCSSETRWPTPPFWGCPAERRPARSRRCSLESGRQA